MLKSWMGVLATVVVVGAAPAAAGQAATFVIVRGADTLAVEQSVRSANALTGELALRANGIRIRYAAALGSEERVSSFETWVHRGADTATLQHMSVAVQRDSTIAVVDGVTHALATPPGTLPYLNPSATLLEQIFRRARATGGAAVDVPVLSIAGASMTPAHVVWLGADSAVLTIAGSELRAAFANGVLRGAVASSQGVRFERLAAPRALDVPPPAPPDYSAPAGAPYTAEEVQLRTPGGLTLAGTLTLPTRRGARVPAVVTITGSGPEERDEGIPTVRGYRPFRQIADTLGRRGIAVLRLDDRGTGKSTGTLNGATTADLADDISAALAYLRTRPDIDGARLALVGHSEGGVIAPMIAARDRALRAIVLLAGPALTGRAILAYQQRYAIDSMSSVPAAQRDSAYAAAARELNAQAEHNAWLRYFLDYDPLATARRVAQPVLILQGATDRQVTAAQAEQLAAAFRAGGNRDVTVRVFPATNHLFLPDSSGNPSRYASLADTRVRSEVLGTLADWLVARLR